MFFYSQLEFGKQVVIVTFCSLLLLAPLLDPMEWSELCNVSVMVVLFFFLGGLVQEKVYGIKSFMSVTKSH